LHAGLFARTEVVLHRSCTNYSVIATRYFNHVLPYLLPIWRLAATAIAVQKVLCVELCNAFLEAACCSQQLYGSSGLSCGTSFALGGADRLMDAG